MFSLFAARGDWIVRARPPLPVAHLLLLAEVRQKGIGERRPFSSLPLSAGSGQAEGKGVERSRLLVDLAGGPGRGGPGRQSLSGA